MGRKVRTPPINVLAEDHSDRNEELIDRAIRIQTQLETLKNPYIGNKRKIVVDIALFIDKHGLMQTLEEKMVLDLFVGSGPVSFLFKGLGARVWSNDILYSSCLYPIAHVVNNDIELSTEEIEHLRSPNKNSNGFVESRHANTRFTPEEAQFIDNYYANVSDIIDHTSGTWLIRDGEWNPSTAHYQTERIKFAIAMSSILGYIMDRCQVGGRLNHGQVFADLDHRVQHPRNSGRTMGFKFLPTPMRIDGKNCIATQGDALSNIQRAISEKKFIQDVGIIYIDPPYGGQQSDYPFMYSFAEEYVHQTPFESIKDICGNRKYTKKSGYSDDFNNLLSALPKDPAWIFSYNDDSWGTKEEITKMIQNFKSDVIIEEVAYRYQQREDRSSAKEYLILAK